MEGGFELVFRAGGQHTSVARGAIPALNQADTGVVPWEQRLIERLRIQHYAWRTEQTYRWRKPAQLNYDYRYDPLYRLVRSDDSEGHFTTYDYDAVGNRTREVTNDDPTLVRKIDTTTTEYTYDAANQLVAALSGDEPRGNADRRHFVLFQPHRNLLEERGLVGLRNDLLAVEERKESVQQQQCQKELYH